MTFNSCFTVYSGITFDISIFRNDEREAGECRTVEVFADDANEAAENARRENQRRNEWVKVVRVWKISK